MNGSAAHGGGNCMGGDSRPAPGEEQGVLARPSPAVERPTIPSARSPLAFPSYDKARYRCAAMPAGERDRELVARANRGDTAAFEEICRHYRDFVFGLAKRRLGNTDDALDVVQETFLKLFVRFPGFELSAAMASFLSTVVEHLCRDRREARLPTVDIAEIDRDAEVFAVESDIAARIDAARLLAQLMPEQCELLTLRYIDDLSLPQLAETLGVPVGTIKSRLHRATATLRGKMDTPLRRRE